ncbi:MAG: hypothetical protein ABL982_17075, partial [Vicinamibacterales bacterium]
ARVQIDELLSGAPEDASSARPTTSTTTTSSRGRLPWIAATAGVVGLLAMASPTLRHLRETPPPAPPEMRVEITTPATDTPLDFALSPDGRSLVFVASGDGAPRLWLRPLDQTEARPLAGTEGAASPFWSPDSRSIGFLAAGKLLRVDLAGGAPQVLATTIGNSYGGSWNADGTILYTPGAANPLWRITAAGGEPTAVTRLEPPGQPSHRHPQFLPDGQHFLFFVRGTPDTAGINLGSLDGGAPTRLTAADSAGAFLPPDRVLFVQAGTLVSRRLDLAGLALTGEPVTLADRVGVGAPGRGGFALSGTGLVAYRVGGIAARQLTWVDRTGKAVGVAGEPDANDVQRPELSPDGRRVAMARTVSGNQDIWMRDLLRGGMTRLTFDAAFESGLVAGWRTDRLQFEPNRRQRSLCEGVERVWCRRRSC